MGRIGGVRWMAGSMKKTKLKDSFSFRLPALLGMTIDPHIFAALS